VIALQAEGMTSLTELRADLADLNELWLEYLVGRLEAAQDQGEVAPGVDLRGTATAILGLLRGTASQFLIDPERVDLRAAGEAAKVMLSAALFENVASYGTQDT